MTQQGALVLTASSARTYALIVGEQVENLFSTQNSLCHIVLEGDLPGYFACARCLRK